jgi:cellulose synthase/poly-beta-1,6-N-acetylglucosamine synthase-like glycosyltransferase
LTLRRDAQLPAQALPAQTDLLICVTLYNESAELLARSLDSIGRCLDHMRAAGEADLAAQTALCIIADGDRRMADDCRAMAVARGFIDADWPTAPDDEHMTVFRADVRGPGHGTQPSSPTVFFAVKHRNRGKLDSHWWFFRKFAPACQPTLCVQTDAGTLLSDNALLEMWRIARRDPSVGAIAARIEVQQPQGPKDLLWSYQHGEFLLSRLISWPAEANLGYMTCVPGQLCGLRWAALNAAGPDGSSALDRYFCGLSAEQPFETTRFLAEDRVLGFETMAASHGDYHIHYAVDCVGRTEACETLADLVKQRRRWINSGFTCRIYMQANLGRYLRTSTSNWWRKLRTLFTGGFALSLSNALEWLAPTLLVTPLILAFRGAAGLAARLGWSAFGAYGILALLWFAPSLLVLSGHAQRVREADLQRLLGGAALGSVGMLALGAYALPAATLLVLTFELALLPANALLNASALGKDVTMRYLRTGVQYLLLALPLSFALTLYAITNLHDASWGTKGLNKLQLGGVDETSLERRERAFRRFRRRVVGSWIASNGLIVAGSLVWGAWVLFTVSGLLLLWMLTVNTASVGLAISRSLTMLRRQVRRLHTTLAPTELPAKQLPALPGPTAS